MSKIEISRTGTKVMAGIGREAQPDSAHVKTSGQYEAVATGPVEYLRWAYVRLLAMAKGDSKTLKGIANFLLPYIPIEMKWSDSFSNTTTFEGRNFLLDKFLAGVSYTANWYVGLISITGYTSVSENDTAASHAGWTEDVEYSETVRHTSAWVTASAGSKSLSAAAIFNINGDGTTIKGCFLCTDNTKSGTSGTLYSAGLFAGGDKVLGNGDTLNVSYTATVS